MNHEIVIGIVVGEASGDILGAALMRELRRIYPSVRFEGIGGPRMLEEGFTSFFAQDRLAVMGIVEPLQRIFELLKIRRFLRNHFIANPPAVFIGIDSPDFTIPLERKLKEAGIKTTHYVSPSVWAWRQSRVFKIAKSVDLMLTLLPFEAAFYEKHKVPVVFVGHHLADEIPLEIDAGRARDNLGIAKSAKVVGLLPGSRSSEIEKMGSLFMNTAVRLLEYDPTLVFYIPAANHARFLQLQKILEDFKDYPIHLVPKQSHKVIAASDVVLLASGTVTFEALLHKKPMVVAYKLSGLSYWILSKLVKTRYVSLPNLLANAMLVPEYLQTDASVENLSKGIIEYLASPSKSLDLAEKFHSIHNELRRNASESAAKAIAALIGN